MKTRLLLCALLVVACENNQEQVETDSGVAQPGTRPVAKTATRDSATSIGEDGHNEPPPTPILTMREHMARLKTVLDTASGTTIQRFLPNHPQMLDSTILSMTEELKRRNTAPTPSWTTLVDSVRRDLTALSSAVADSLPALMRVHHARIERLMQLHRTATGRPAGT